MSATGSRLSCCLSPGIAQTVAKPTLNPTGKLGIDYHVKICYNVIGHRSTIDSYLLLLLPQPPHVWDRVLILASDAKG